MPNCTVLAGGKPSPIPNTLASLVGREMEYIQQAIDSRRLQGNGAHTQACQAALKTRLGVSEALLTQSCSAALEMAALLCNLEPGDEVIMPSFTFVATATAVVLRRAVPVFVDIRPDTFNIDERLVEAAITPRTRAIFAVHYAGVCAEMDALRAIADRHGLMLVEDAAQALGSTYYGRPAGALADLGALSFHDTKNIISGEGGALTVARTDLVDRAYVLWEKGTDRRKFHLGLVDKYSWVDVGSSFLPSELTAAVLRAQLECMDAVNGDRLNSWSAYHQALEPLEQRGLLRRPIVPEHCRHNGHIYAILLADEQTRNDLLAVARQHEIGMVYHYVPLHSAPAGRKYGRSHGDLPVTEKVAATLLRLPLWHGVGDHLPTVVDHIFTFLRGQRPPDSEPLQYRTL